MVFQIPFNLVRGLSSSSSPFSYCNRSRTKFTPSVKTWTVMEDDLQVVQKSLFIKEFLTNTIEKMGKWKTETCYARSSIFAIQYKFKLKI